MNKLSISLIASVASAILSLAGAYAHAQQNYVGRYDLYAGFTDIDSPALGLNQNGFHTQIGFTPKTWYSVGFDYSVASGSEILTPSELPAALQAQVAAAQAGYTAAGLLPPTYKLMVPTDAYTQTFAFGPQYINRHFSKLSLFVRPSLGALRERAVPRPATDPFQKAIIAQLAPAGFKRDWTGFYGFGGGGDFLITKNFGVRAQIDIVHNHPFDDILARGRWTYRYSVGPSFHFGKNVATLHDRGPKI
jgi:hypothetical protein